MSKADSDWHGDMMNAAEREVMALFDDGLSLDEIAKATGLKWSRVKNITSHFKLNGNDDFEEAIRAGSIALRRAIARVGGKH